GKLGAVTTKLLLETVALLTVTAADPELVAVTVSVFVVPAATPPKSTLAFASDRLPTCCWVSLGGFPALRPWQAARKESPERSITRRAVFQKVFAPSGADSSRAGEFGVIGCHEPSPPTAIATSVSGEDYEQCGPIFPDKTDFGGTYLFQAEGQGSNREWPDTASGNCGLLACYGRDPQKNGKTGSQYLRSRIINRKLRLGLLPLVDR